MNFSTNSSIFTVLVFSTCLYFNTNLGPDIFIKGGLFCLGLVLGDLFAKRFLTPKKS